MKANDLKASIYQILIVFVSCILTACTLPQEDLISPSPPVETITSTLPPTTTTMPQDMWIQIAVGLEQRTYDVNSRTQLLVLRINPSLYSFRAHYEPGITRSLGEWQDTLPEAAVFINANYYQPDFTALGLTIVDGQAYGVPFTDRGGMFYVQSGQHGIRSNINQPYNGESLDQAIQAWPMLVHNSGQAYTRQSRSARRSAIGIDSEGHVLFIVTARGTVSLPELSTFLAESDMAIRDAFNLDGGGSTMLSVNTNGTAFQVPSFDTVPVVMAVYAR